MCGPSRHFAPISIAGSSVSGEPSYRFTADPNPRNGEDVDDLRRAARYTESTTPTRLFG